MIEAIKQTITGAFLYAKTPATSAPTIPIYMRAVSTVNTPGITKAVIAVYGISIKNFANFSLNFNFSIKNAGKTLGKYATIAIPIISKAYSSLIIPLLFRLKANFQW